VAERTSSLLDELAVTLRDAGLDAFVRPGHAGAPDQLLVVFDPAGTAAGLHAQLLFLPGADEPPILQYYVALACSVPDEIAGVMCRFLNAANAPLPLGAFGLLEVDKVVFYRFNAPARLDPFDADMVGWTLTMAEYVVGELAPLIEAVAGGMGLDEALGFLASTLQQIEAEADGLELS
jgi:hypothetical protein